MKRLLLILSILLLAFPAYSAQRYLIKGNSGTLPAKGMMHSGSYIIGTKGGVSVFTDASDAFFVLDPNLISGDTLFNVGGNDPNFTRSSSANSVVTYREEQRRTNMLTNGDFESGNTTTGSWEKTAMEGGDTFDVSVAQLDAGSTYSGYCNVDATIEGVYYTQALTSGKTYRITLRYYIVAGEIYTNDGNGVADYASPTLSTTGSWLTYTVEVSATSTGSERFMMRSVNAAAEWYFDLTLEELETEPSGTELWDGPASRFDSGTYNWVKYGTNLLTNDSNTLKIECVDGGSGAYDYFRDSEDLNTDLTVGQAYRLSFDARVDSGDSVRLQVSDGSTTHTIDDATNTSFQTFTYDFVAQHATNGFMNFGLMAVGEIIWIDNLSLQALVKTGNVVEYEFVTNGTMEDDSNWADYNGTPTVNERSTEQVRSGTYSRKCTRSAGFTGIQSDAFSPTPVVGVPMRASFWFYPVDSNRIKYYHPQTGWENATGTQGAWNKASITFTYAAAYPKLYFVADDVNRTFYLDDVELKEITWQEGYIVQEIGPDIPRIAREINGRDWFVFEEEATNSIKYSHDINEAEWTKAASTAVSGYGVKSPSGVSDVWGIAPNNNNSTHYIADANISHADEANIIYSVDILQANPTENNPASLYLGFDDTHGVRHYASFDLDADSGGTVIASSKVSSYGVFPLKLNQGWYRCWIKATGGVVGVGPDFYVQVTDANGGITFRGADQVVNSGSSGASVYVTNINVFDDEECLMSSIPTEGAATTRNADTLSFDLPTTQSTPDYFSGTSNEGTLLVLWRPGFDKGDHPASHTGIFSCRDSQLSLLQISSTGRLRSFDGTDDAFYDYTFERDRAIFSVIEWGKDFNNDGDIDYRVGVIGPNETTITWGTEDEYDGGYILGNNLQMFYNGFGRQLIGGIWMFDHVKSTDHDNDGTYESTWYSQLGSP